MSSPALTRGLRKAARQVTQMAAAGSLTVLVSFLAHGLSPTTEGLVLAVWGVVVVFLHNWAESAGVIPVLLPTPALIPVAATVGAVLAPVAGAVEAVADTAGRVTGAVTDVTGAVVGKVTGLLDDEKGTISSGILWAVVAMVVFFALLGGACASCFNGSSNSLGRIVLVSHHDDDGNSGGDYGNGNDQRHCHESENCRGSFSPGPFDRSPVDIHDNQVCISPDCSSHKDDKKGSK